MIISNIAIKSFLLICKSYLSIIVYNFWNVLSCYILAISNQLDTFAAQLLLGNVNKLFVVKRSKYYVFGLKDVIYL